RKLGVYNIQIPWRFQCETMFKRNSIVFRCEFFAFRLALKHRFGLEKTWECPPPWKPCPLGPTPLGVRAFAAVRNAIHQLFEAIELREIELPMSCRHAPF